MAETDNGPRDVNSNVVLAAQLACNAMRPRLSDQEIAARLEKKGTGTVAHIAHALNTRERRFMRALPPGLVLEMNQVDATEDPHGDGQQFVYTGQRIIDPSDNGNPEYEFTVVASGGDNPGSGIIEGEKIEITLGYRDVLAMNVAGCLPTDKEKSVTIVRSGAHKQKVIQRQERGNERSGRTSI